VHAAWDQLWLLRRQFPHCFKDDVASSALPLFPTLAGLPPTKLKMTETIVRMAQLLGAPLRTEDGSERISGHSLRATGAQGLTHLGLDIWAVQLLGRWGSTTVQSYVREAAVSPEAALARRHLLGTTLAQVVSQHRAELAHLDFEETVGVYVARAVADLGPKLETLEATLRTDLAEVIRTTVAQRPAADADSDSSSTSSSDSHDGAAPGDEDPCEALAPPDVAAAAAQVSVSSQYSSKRHRVLIGPEVTLSKASWVTVCGWRFGRLGGPRDGARDPRDGDTPCQKCWPSSSV